MLITFAIIIRILANSLSNVWQKKLAENGLKPMLINLVMYIGLTVICIPLIAKIDFKNLNLNLWIYSILGGLFGAFGNSYLVKALKNGELSVLGPINAYKSVVAMIFGIVLLKEIPSAIGIFAVGLIIAGSYFIFDTQKEGFTLELFKRNDIRYRFYALFLTALEALCIKNVINESDIVVAFIAWCVFGMLFCGVFSFKEIANLKTVSKISVLYLVMIIICMGIMQLSTNYVFSNFQVSYGLALFQLSAIVNVILGWKIFSETNILKKSFGTLIMIIGAVILILYK